MIQVHKINEARDKDKLVGQFDPLKDTWVVSDLRTKLYLQKRWLSHSEGIVEESVLRISELWRRLLLRARPDLNIVSSDFIRMLIKQYFSEQGDGSGREWTRMPGVVDTAIQYLSQLLPVVSHPEGIEVLQEWMEQNPEALARWGHWLTESFSIWNFLQVKKIILPQWVPGVLVNSSNFTDHWQRDLFFDIGAELKSHESLLLFALGERLNVQVLGPSDGWIETYSSLFYPYQALSTLTQVTPATDLPSAAEPIDLGRITDGVGLRRYATQVAEVKDCVAQVRMWLDQGARPERLAVIAPDIEGYWPVLSEYLRIEGIPVAKEEVTSAQAFADVGQWLSQLRIFSRRVRSGDLELSLFGGQESQISHLSVEQFKSYFNIIYDESDLQRHPDVEALFHNPMDTLREIERDQFITFALKHWPGYGAIERLERILRTVLAEVGPGVTLFLADWVDYLERMAAKIEITVQKGKPCGVHIVGLMSAEELPVDKMFFMGLSEQALAQETKSGLLLQDVKSIALHTGFQLLAPESNKLQYQLHWVLHSNRQEVILGYSETDFLGQVQAPSLLWLMLDHNRWNRANMKFEETRAAPGNEAPQLTTEPMAPRLTRWDEIQQVSELQMNHYRPWSHDKLGAMVHRIQEDVGDRTPPRFGQYLIQRVSATGIETYLTCPFQLAAQRVFRLVDLPDLDLDIDHRSRGSLLHRLLELLLDEPLHLQYTDDELITLIDRCYAEVAKNNSDQRLWKGQRRRYLAMVKRFLRFEQSWREQFPQTKTLAREAAVKGWLHVQDGALFPASAVDDLKIPAEQVGRKWLKFSGKVDRIDGDSNGQRVIIDYKSSVGALGHYNHWVERGHLQMALYSIALENGLILAVPPAEAAPPRMKGGGDSLFTQSQRARSLQGTVVGAVYFTLKDMKRHRGFLMEQGADVLYPEKLAKAKISNEGRQDLFSKVQNLTAKTCQKIVEGEFAAQPSEETVCDRCNWRNLCRYHRLS